jgi:hypothetical protein
VNGSRINDINTLLSGVCFWVYLTGVGYSSSKKRCLRAISLSIWAMLLSTGSTSKGFADEAQGRIPLQLCRRRLGNGEGTNDPVPLSEIVCGYGSSRCIDSQDGAFGLHSLVFHCCRKPIPVDYSRSAHRLETMLDFDHIMVMGAGRVVELDTLEELHSVYSSKEE